MATDEAMTTRRWRHVLRWRLAPLLVLAALLAIGMGTLLAFHAEGTIELDRNVVSSDRASGSPGAPDNFPPGPGEIPSGDDWDRVCKAAGVSACSSVSGSLASSAASPTFVQDGDDFSGGVTVPAGLPIDDTTYFTGGGSKDVNDIPQWRHTSGDQAPDKDEILNAGAVAYTKDTDGDSVPELLIYFFLDRFANNGDAQVGFWFFQGSVGLNANGTFSGAHQVGDILVLSHFTQGGDVDTIQVYQWVGPPDADNLDLIATGVDCSVTAPDDTACATVNKATTSGQPPWPYVTKFPERGASANNYAPSTFYEGGINATKLGLEGCLQSFLAETRSSQSLDAQLKDFALGTFSLCSINVEKSGDELSKVGDAVNYTITITNTGAVTLYKDDITDSLLGNITLDSVDQSNSFITGNTCGASLAPGASCTITATRTVQAGDPDPLPNTVTVVYKGKSDLSGTAITDSDTHSVNLFIPNFTITKTGDTLSKVGDEVTYTFTITNTSSADSPNLTLVSISDDKLGNLSAQATAAGCDVLTSSPAETCSFTVNHTIPSGASDPYVNQVTAVYQVAGFPNQLSRSDTHSVNLFQPAINIEKTGDTLSKAGDDVTYTFTLTNSSSADTPALTCTVTDTLLGTVFGPAVLPLGTTTVQRTRTVQPTDPDPLVNTATMSCTIAGFPNVLTDSDSHSVDLVHPGLTVAKLCAPTSAQVGETITYTCTITNTGDVQLNKVSITDSLVGDLTSNPGCGASLAPGASCTITYTRTIQSGDPDPLVNTVTAVYQVNGLPNQLTASASCTVDIIPGEGCTPGFWRNHTNLWDGSGSDDLPQPDAAGHPLAPFTTDDEFNAVFGVTQSQSDLSNATMLLDAVELTGGGKRALARHAAAALINAALADSTVDYPYTVAQVINLYRDAVGAISGPETVQSALQKLEEANELFCPLN